LTGGYQFHSLSRFYDVTLPQGKLFMFRPRLANGDEWRGFRQTIDVSDGPAELALDALDGRCRGRSAGRDYPNARTYAAPHLFRSVRQEDQDCRSGAQRSYPLGLDPFEHGPGVHLGQTDMSPAHGGHGPNECP